MLIEKIHKTKRKRDWESIFTKTVTVMALLALLVGSLATQNTMLARVFQSIHADTILIDPGHGGMDGGAVSASGVSEKDINLAIAIALRDLALADGWNVIMTRETDQGLYGERDKRTIRSLKVEDLKKRREIIQSTEPKLVVSIHLNSFKEDRSVRGAQTFFPTQGENKEVLGDSKLLAESIQESLIQGLQDGTEREALAKRGVLLLKNPIVPTVIVECGFLSNHEEAMLLSDVDYQQKLARCIYDGIKKHTGWAGLSDLPLIDSTSGPAL